VSVVEGVMGLFDGRGPSGRHSTAEIARLLRCPVLLVVDASASSTSVGAEVLGFRRYDPRVPIAGAIVNNVAGESHAAACRTAVRRAGVRVLGCVPREPGLILPERHLGLVPLAEQASGTGAAADNVLGRIANHVSAHVDLDAVTEISRRVAPLPAPHVSEKPGTKATVRPRLAVAYDAAFFFYYRDGLEALEAAGADLVYFSPLAGEMPEADAMYLGGGFPETHIEALEKSPATRRIKAFCESGSPVLAECGGLMYLTRLIEGIDGRRGRMVGFLDAETRMVPKLTLAYTFARVERECVLSAPGRSLRGHEFHHSAIGGVPTDARFAYSMVVGTGITDRRDGWMEGGVLASYMHSHLAAGAKARRFVNLVRGSR
jgi:cobyrinic acid a,c-diamide synthase